MSDHGSIAIWLTGLPASGKSRIVAALKPQLEALGLSVEVLESDAVRRTLTPAPTYSQGAIGQGHYAFGVRSARLATTAMGLGGLFVMQSASSNLYALRDRVRHGMACRGPSLFSIFSGSPGGASELPPYLAAAAAMKSRAYPAFTYDANAGTNWATRFSLENNRNPDADWPVEEFEYADENVQRVREQVRFTYADFALGDQRHAHHFAVVPRERWTAAMIPVADWLALADTDSAERVPYVLAVDGDDRLHRVIVDAKLIQATRRCLLLWHRLGTRRRPQLACRRGPGARKGRVGSAEAAGTRRPACLTSIMIYCPTRNWLNPCPANGSRFGHQFLLGSGQKVRGASPSYAFPGARLPRKLQEHHR